MPIMPIFSVVLGIALRIRDKMQVVSKETTRCKVKSKEPKWNLIGGILFK